MPGLIPNVENALGRNARQNSILEISEDSPACRIRDFISDMEKYWAIPYVRGGRDWTGADCFGFVLLWYRNELGITLPDYRAPQDDAIFTKTACGLYQRLYAVFEAVSSPERHDLALMRSSSGRVLNHIGICIDSERIIHMSYGTGVTVIAIQRAKPIISAFYRYKDLTKCK